MWLEMVYLVHVHNVTLTLQAYASDIVMHGHGVCVCVCVCVCVRIWRDRCYVSYEWFIRSLKCVNAIDHKRP